MRCNAVGKGIVMMEKYTIIVNAEEQFAREVTLGVIVTRPLTIWHSIIPGMFVIDFLRRGSAIRQYTKHFMFPRKLAMNAAVAEIQGENAEYMDSDLADHIRIRLESLKLYSPDLVKAYVELIKILAAHYLKLLNAEGDTFYLLLEHAYQHRDNYKQFIETITSAESKVDRQVIEKLGGQEKVKGKILAEQQQIAKRRRKILEEVF
jgi:bacterioferritin (cytochrome b1)